MTMSLMHRWHDSRVGEGFLTPSHYLLCLATMIMIFCRGVWIYPRFESVSVSVSGDWYCVQYRPFTYLGASYSNYWGLPSHYLGYLRGLPSVWLWELKIVMTWARVHFDSVYAGDCIDSVHLILFSLYICFLFPTWCLFMLPYMYTSVISHFIITACICYICSLGFLAQPHFFSPRQVIQAKLGLSLGWELRLEWTYPFRLHLCI